MKYNGVIHRKLSLLDEQDFRRFRDEVDRACSERKGQGVSLSRKALQQLAEPRSFSIKDLGSALDRACPGVTFALIFGSGRDGIIPPHGDLDLAFFTVRPPDISFYSTVEAVCRNLVPGVRCDTGILNNAEPIYCFEAIKGTLLFTRDAEVWAGFFSRTCRLYEHKLYHYEKQLQYRLERIHLS